MNGHSFDNFTQELLDYYAELIVSPDLSDDNNPIKKWRKNIDLDQYTSQFKMIQDCYKTLQAFYSQGDKKHPVESCAELVIKLISDEKGKIQQSSKVKLFQEMIDRTFKKQKIWNNKECEVYDILISRYHHFFFSYTNRGAHALNQSYKELLDHALDESERQKYKTRRHNEINLLAYLICNRFRKLDLRCFYDNKDIQFGDNLNEIISQSCQTALTFVQLISDETFLKKVNGDQTNWCFEEYNTFKKFALGKTFFICCEDMNTIHTQFDNHTMKEWNDEFKSKLFCQLNPKISFNEFKLIMLELAERIVKSCNDIKQKLIDSLDKS